MTSGVLNDQRALLDDYLHRYGQNLSSCAYVNLFAWQDFWQYDIRLIDDHLCVFARYPLGVFMILPPLGARLRGRAVDECFRVMNAVNAESGFSRIDNVGVDLLSVFFSGGYACYRKGYEYLYYRPDIVGLKGNAYKSKRADYNYFTRRFRYRIRPFAEAMTAECGALYDEWAVSRMGDRDDVYRQMLAENRTVHRLVMRRADDLGLVGRVVEVNGRIRAYTFGYPLNRDVFCVLFEIADLSLKGLPVLIFREFCADRALAPYHFINAMDDVGLRNMTRTKLSFRPRVLLPVYTVTQQ